MDVSHMLCHIELYARIFTGPSPDRTDDTQIKSLVPYHLAMGPIDLSDLSGSMSGPTFLVD